MSDDLDASLAQLSDLFGYEWCGPRIELVTNELRPLLEQYWATGTTPS